MSIHDVDKACMCQLHPLNPDFLSKIFLEKYFLKRKIKFILIKVYKNITIRLIVERTLKIENKKLEKEKKNRKIIKIKVFCVL